MSSRPIIRPVRLADRDELLRMRQSLWPDPRASEVDDVLQSHTSERVVLVAERRLGTLCGFAEVGSRAYDEGCATSPVAYPEGIWVDPDARRGSVGRALVRDARAWARTHGFRELASDCDVDDDQSLAFHLALGFVEAQRIVCLCMDLDDDLTR